jgi:hypothetical protein
MVEGQNETFGRWLRWEVGQKISPSGKMLCVKGRRATSCYGLLIKDMIVEIVKIDTNISKRLMLTTNKHRTLTTVLKPWWETLRNPWCFLTKELLSKQNIVVDFKVLQELY